MAFILLNPSSYRYPGGQLGLSRLFCQGHHSQRHLNESVEGVPRCAGSPSLDSQVLAAVARHLGDERVKGLQSVLHKMLRCSTQLRGLARLDSLFKHHVQGWQL